MKLDLLIGKITAKMMSSALVLFLLTYLVRNGLSARCKGCEQYNLTHIKMDFTGPDVLTQSEFESAVLDKDLLGFYNIQKIGGNMFEHHGLVMRIKQRQSEQPGTLHRNLRFNFQRRNASTCITREGTMSPYYKDKAIYRINRFTGGSPDKVPVEINFSSCPTKYMCSLVCSNLILSDNSCNEDDVDLMIKVFSKVDPLDDLPLEQLTRDIRRNTNMKFGRHTNLKTILTFGDDSCNWPPGS